MNPKCPKCDSDSHKHEKTLKGQRYKCIECNHTFVGEAPKSTIGTPIDQWQDEYDVDIIVKRVMDSLDKDMMYERNDIYTLCKKSASYPGLGRAIDSFTSQFGKAGGKQFFSHPVTINHYKSKGRLT